jgi:hypothetical protein
MFWDDVFQSSVAAFRTDFPPPRQQNVALDLREEPRKKDRAKRAAPRPLRTRKRKSPAARGKRR